MVKRIVFGLIWCIVLYFAACALTGGIAGGIAGSRAPANASTIGAQAGVQTVLALRGYFVVGAIVLSIVGTWAGILPGTRRSKPPEPPA